MKIVVTLLLLLTASQSFAEGWEGKKARVPKGTLLCELYAIERANILKRAGAEDSLQAFIKKGACLIAPQEYFVIVTRDASDIYDPWLAQVMIGEASVWVEMDAIKCCYK